jgi:nitroreductase/ferredoxin
MEKIRKTWKIRARRPILHFVISHQFHGNQIMAPLLSLNESSCTFCGDCATACPMGAVTVDACGPRIADDDADRCILCGHCVAACPKTALRHSRLNMEECRPLAAGWRSNPHAVEQLIEGRRSIRHYLPQAVEKSVLTSVIEIARHAPTGMNSQTVEWLVIYERSEVKTLASAVIEWMRNLTAKNELVAGRYNAGPLVAAWDAGHDPILRGCPHVVIAHGAASDPFAQSSCTIALTTLELAALPFGLGACWAGFLHLAATCSAEVRQVLGLPHGHIMQGGLMIGYPLETYHCVPPRKRPPVAWR